MLRVPIKMAKPGMKLAAAVHHPHRPDQVLLRIGFELDEKAIERLSDMAVAELWIHHPQLAFVSRYINPHALTCQAKLGAMVTQLFDSLEMTKHLQLEYPVYRSMVRNLLDKLIEDPKAALFIQEINAVSQPLMRHSVNVAVLAMLMGLKLDSYLVDQRRRLPANRAKCVENLGIAGVFHDMGMLQLSREARERWREEHDERNEEWRSHVQLGHEMVQGVLEPSAGSAVLHHHQRWDGSGFPEVDSEDGPHGLAGEKIHVYSRILATADVFDRARREGNERLKATSAPQEERPAAPNVIALSRVLAPEVSRRLDPVTIRALLHIAPAYPPGTVVTLSDGSHGAVCEWHPLEPCRPTVQMVGDDFEKNLTAPDNERFDEEPDCMDLRRRTELEIVETEGWDVRNFNFYAEDETTFALTHMQPESQTEKAA